WGGMSEMVIAGHLLSEASGLEDQPGGGRESGPLCAAPAASVKKYELSVILAQPSVVESRSDREGPPPWDHPMDVRVELNRAEFPSTAANWPRLRGHSDSGSDGCVGAQPSVDHGPVIISRPSGPS